MAFTDTDIYLEAKPGDKGSHTDPVLWLSDDIQIVAPTLNVAEPSPTVNKVQVRIHRKGNVQFPASAFVQVDVFVADPSIGMTRTASRRIVNDTVQTSSITPDTQAPGGKVVTYDWTVGGTAQEAPGHKCLIAQCYPTTDAPDNAFDLKEQHTAQHNITIKAAPVNAPFRFEMLIGNEGPRPRNVKVNAFLDLQVHRRILDVMEPLARREPAFRKFLRLRDLDDDLLFPQLRRRGGIDTDVLTRRPTEGIDTGVLRRQPPGGIDRNVILRPHVLEEADQMVQLRDFFAEAAPRKFALQSDDFPDARVIDNSTELNPRGLFGRRLFPNVEARLRLEPEQVSKFAFSADISNARPGQAQVYHFTQTGEGGAFHGGLTLVVIPT